MKQLAIALSALSLLGASTMASAAATQCRDSHGKFVKCPEKKAAAPTKCRDAKGHYAKCGTKGAKPA